MSLYPISFNQTLIGLYIDIFPEVIANCDFSDNESLRKVMEGVLYGKAKWYGIMEKNELIGFCTIGAIDDNKYLLYNVGIEESERNKGWGSLLMNEIVNLHGSSDIYLFVDKNKRSVIKLYRKNNFEYEESMFVPPPHHICMCRHA